jgi:NAD(P)H-dependent flavin oxidoreductase YrpB (nitropropane dioxygenase family)
MSPPALATPFTRLVGCTAPIQLAAMPGIGTIELAAAVANAGGLGMIGVPLMPAEQVAALIGQLAARTTGVFGVNFLMPFLEPAAVDVAARTARVVEFFYDTPQADLVARARAYGALVSWQVGSLAEAHAAEQAGCDFVVVQGTEAGGHVRGRTSLLPLLAQVLEAVRVPVVAAGGIATGRDLAAVLASGAAAARVGTRFLATAESGAHPAYVAAILAAEAGDTCLTEAFSVMWPNAPHRVLRAAVAAAEQLAPGPIGEIRLAGTPIPVERLSVIAPTVETTGTIEAMALYAGESVGSVHSVEPAAAIVAELVTTAARLLGRAA